MLPIGTDGAGGRNPRCRPDGGDGDAGGGGGSAGGEGDVGGIGGGDADEPGPRARNGTLGPGGSDRVVERGDLLEILGNRRRRLLWALLHRRDGPVDLADASREVAARERGVDPAAVTSEERKSVYASLYQHHCPVMSEAGAVAFDREESTVEAVPAAERQRFLDLAIDSRAVARAVAGALAAVTGVVGVGWALGAPVLGSLTPTEFGAVVGVSVAVSVTAYAAVVSRRYPVRLGDLLSAADGTDR
ncbi:MULTISPECIES: DUF7344 domain-containing protein [Halorubrum]|uniref:DUF7344 domain-containing protein n=1 Tax=Halorubrum hochstenium ATCC 700873 TaxID=1227481 RepID=M0FIU0_9EURY|nr:MULTISPECIES: hypothetical protein [Halorubrum]ELZ59931.1 hypothetical protein C467_02731 [Halorubrum hochstenium ATCC 700873]